MTVVAEEVSRSGVVGAVFALGTVEPGGSVVVDYGEGCLLPDFKGLALEEYEIMIVLGATQPTVGAWSGAGAGALAVFF